MLTILQPQILLCRFLLNLRQLNHPIGRSEGTHPSDLPTIQFQINTRVIANFGEPLQGPVDESQVEASTAEEEPGIALGTFSRSENGIEPSTTDINDAAVR